MKNPATETVLQNHSPEKIIEALSPFLTDHRKARIASVVRHRLDSITVAVELPGDINNALAIVRTCEALGIAAMHIISAEHATNYIQNITKSAFYWVNIIFHNTLDEFLAVMKTEKRLLFGAVLNAEKKLSDVSIDKPICLLFGNEHHGLSDEAKKACDGLYSIPMCGMLESLNLSVAAAISLFDASERKRAQIRDNTDLSDNLSKKLTAKFYLNSVNPKVANHLFPTPHAHHP